MSGGRHPRWFLIVGLLLAFGLPGVAARAGAAIINPQDFTGRFDFSNGVSGTVNFAVMPSSDFFSSFGSYTFSPAVLMDGSTTVTSGSLDPSSTWVYLFQVTNTGSVAIGGLSESLNGGTVTAAGWYSGVILNLDFSGAITPMSGLPLFTDATVQSFTSGSTADPNALSPDVPMLVTQGTDASIKWTVEIGTGAIGSLLVYTSNFDPAFVDGAISDRGTSAQIGLPGPGGAYDQTAVPEPGTLVLLGSGLIGLAAARPLRRRH